MSGLQETSATVQRVIVLAIVAYFGLFVYAAVAENPVAYDLAQALFGVIAVTIGVVLYRGEDEERTPITAAAVFLVVGGLAQFAWLATDDAVYNTVATFTVFLGVGIYLFYVWAGDGT